MILTRITNKSNVKIKKVLLNQSLMGVLLTFWIVANSFKTLLILDQKKEWKNQTVDKKTMDWIWIEEEVMLVIVKNFLILEL